VKQGVITKAPLIPLSELSHLDDAQRDPADTSITTAVASSTAMATPQ
jgi:hypothetical protein